MVGWPLVMDMLVSGHLDLDTSIQVQIHKQDLCSVEPFWGSILLCFNPNQTVKSEVDKYVMPKSVMEESSSDSKILHWFETYNVQFLNIAKATIYCAKNDLRANATCELQPLLIMMYKTNTQCLKTFLPITNAFGPEAMKFLQQY